jgi:hypothetical protein
MARETTVTGRKGALRGPARPVINRRGVFGGQGEHWHLKRDRYGRYRSTARENPNGEGWWIFGIVAGAGALIAGIAYAASSTNPPSQTTTPSPTTPPTGATQPPTTAPVPTTTPAGPPTQLVQGQSFTLHVMCPSPVTQPTAANYPFLAGATIIRVTPTMLLNSTTWDVSFVYNGATMPVPSPMPSPGGCTSTLGWYSNPALHNVGPSPSPT